MTDSDAAKKCSPRPYSGAGLAIGVGLGAGIGAATDNLAIGVGLGVVLGLLAGKWLDRRLQQRRDAGSSQSPG